MRHFTIGRSRRRPGFTLIELLVVMTIILVLAAFVVFAGFRYGDQQKVSTAAGRLQGWLLVAKQRAKRDRAPRGVRLLVTSGLCTQLQYIGDAGDWKDSNGSVPSQDILNPSAGINLSWQWFRNPNPNPNQPYVVRYRATAGNANVDFSKVVQVNDYLEVYGGGLVYRVTDVKPPNSPVSLPTNFPLSYMDLVVTPFPNSPAQDPLQTLASGYTATYPIELNDYPNRPCEIINPDMQRPSTPGTYATLGYTNCYGPAMPTASPITGILPQFLTNQYRVIRQPQPLPGEEPINLPDGVVIDTNTNTLFGNSLAPTYVNPTLTYVDILFSPTGGVTTWKGSSDQIILWVRDATADTPWSGEPHLITVFTRTGLIAAYPIDDTPYPVPVLGQDPTLPMNPYTQTRSGETSGL